MMELIRKRPRTTWTVLLPQTLLFDGQRQLRRWWSRWPKCVAFFQLYVVHARLVDERLHWEEKLISRCYIVNFMTALIIDYICNHGHCSCKRCIILIIKIKIWSHCIWSWRSSSLTAQTELSSSSALSSSCSPPWSWSIPSYFSYIMIVRNNFIDQMIFHEIALVCSGTPWGTYTSIQVVYS